MVQIVFFSLLPLVKKIGQAPKEVATLTAGFVCGVFKAVGVDVYTKNSINEAINLKLAADACSDELPLSLTTEHDAVAQIMEQGGRESVIKAGSILKDNNVSAKCLAIFDLVCNKAQELGALDIVRRACTNLCI